MLKFLCIMCSVLAAYITLADIDIEKKSWPVMKNVNIWNIVMAPNPSLIEHSSSFEKEEQINKNLVSLKTEKNIKKKKAKVFHLFPVPVDGECLSNDGRRTGICFNIYECRLKGGIAQGECSMGFGVCCIFIASCDQTISNNITYLVSPNFPSAMPQNLTSCKYKVKIMDSNISQLRVDFIHFSLGQPNRKTGICDGDVFKVNGGTSGNVSLCGQNSGQHIYYDVDGLKSGHQISSGTVKQSRLKLNSARNISTRDEGFVEVTMSFSYRFSPIRFWEIRIAQIPFSQRAPTRCLQYFTGTEGVVQTFNFADNGRHLANQHYRSCIRQESKMCSIVYEPCDDQSFKIGPTRTNMNIQINMLNDSLPDESIQSTVIIQNSTTSQPNINVPTDSQNNDTTMASSVMSDAEGSGEDVLQLPVTTSRKPVRGGLDILSLFRSAFSFRSLAQSTRQFFTTCNDRITMPCIVEDFVGVGMGPLPGCEPVHCGNRFCASGAKPCRIESTVTPFYLGVNFGNGDGKGSAEDNIGACIRYQQIQCV